MGLLLIAVGLFLWASAHFFKRRNPAWRAELGDRAKTYVALVILAAIGAMYVGYSTADVTYLWALGAWAVPVNNLLVLIAFYCFAASGVKGALARKIRHPQLTGFSLWAVAHLLVNGDLASVILFGGLLAWAVAEILIINAAEPEWTPPDPVPVQKEITAAGAAVVLYVLVGLIHGWVGPWPFGG